MNKTETTIPVHVAVIMDGNGRWAKERGFSRIKGHEEGANSVRAVLKASRDVGVKYLTLYAFSVENWVRPKAEVNALMSLLVRFLRNNEHELHENRVRLRMTGRMADLPAEVQKELERVMGTTRQYERQLILALSYGGRVELVDAVRRIAARVKEGSIQPCDISEETIRQNLYLPDVPDPDLLIRTSGEMRLSNFLLWEVSYTELYVTPVMWPDFREEQFSEAIREYGRRRRRFGSIE